MTGSGHLSWDAETYQDVADPQREWGRAVVDRIRWRGDETVLDAGCGSGDVTRMLAERVPAGRVIAVDGAPERVAMTPSAPSVRSSVTAALPSTGGATPNTVKMPDDTT